MIVGHFDYMDDDHARVRNRERYMVYGGLALFVSVFWVMVALLIYRLT